MRCMTALPHDSSRSNASAEGQAGTARERKLPRGFGSMKDVPLNIDPRIDLTKPIYDQVLALEKADREAAGQD